MKHAYCSVNELIRFWQVQVVDEASSLVMYGGGSGCQGRKTSSRGFGMWRLLCSERVTRELLLVHGVGSGGERCCCNRLSLVVTESVSTSSFRGCCCCRLVANFGVSHRDIQICLRKVKS